MTLYGISTYTPIEQPNLIRGDNLFADQNLENVPLFYNNFNENIAFDFNSQLPPTMDFNNLWGDFNTYLQKSTEYFKQLCETYNRTIEQLKPSLSNNNFKPYLNGNSNALNSLVNFAQTLVGKKAPEMQNLMQNAGVKFHPGVWCADGMRYVAKSVLGDNNMANWYRSCHYPSCPRVYEAAKQNNAVVTEKKEGKIDLSNAKPGQLILFDWQKGSNIDAKNLDHIGMIESIDYERGIVHTLEANVSGGFNRCKRNLNVIQAVVDIT